MLKDIKEEKIAGIFKISHKLGSGSFGECYFATNI